MCSSGKIESSTRKVVDTLYEAFLRGDVAGMLELFAEDISLRFLGQADVRGIGEARRFFAFASSLLLDVSFHIERTIIDGEWGAVVWNETARTLSGEPWVNQGIDIIHVQDAQVRALHENNDVRLVRRHFPRYV